MMSPKQAQRLAAKRRRVLRRQLRNGTHPVFAQVRAFQRSGGWEAIKDAQWGVVVKTECIADLVLQTRCKP